jgi:tetrahydromethanopterin S-methyltransferase subunit G
MHFVTTQIVEKLEEHQKRVKKHPTSLIKRTMETIGRDVAILSWLL